MKDFALAALIIAAWLTTLVLGWLLGVLHEIKREMRRIQDAGREHPENDPGLKP